MAPQTRGMFFPKVVIERDSESEESSSEEEEDTGEECSQVKEKDDENIAEEASTSTKKQPMVISLKKVCKVSHPTPFPLSLCFLTRK